jgi:hypothetical protein
MGPIRNLDPARVDSVLESPMPGRALRFWHSCVPAACEPDTFTYAASNAVLTSEVATITVTIAAVADAPLADVDAYATTEDVALGATGDGVLANDSDPDNDDLCRTQPGHRSVALSPE